MDARNTAQLTVPTKGAQSEADVAEPTPGQANTAVTTDGFKNDGETTSQQGEDVAATGATGDEAQPAEGDHQPKKVAKEGEETGETNKTAQGNTEW